MSLLSKRIRGLTPEDRAELSAPLGVDSIPFPANPRPFQNGLDLSMAGPIPAISTRAYPDFVGAAYSNMVVPSLYGAMRNFYEQGSPDSNSFFTLCVSPYGWGKTEGGINLARQMDDRDNPFVFLNVANRNYEDLLWETVIDLGDDYKTALIERLQNGSLKPASQGVLEENLNHALVKDDKGKIIGLDENKFGLPRGDETHTEALERDLKFLRLIAENEGISHQTQNALGIRKVFNRALEKAMAEGKVLIWDEFSKGIENTWDPLLEFMAWANGRGPDIITLRSTFSVNGREETATRTLDRNDRAVGFRIWATGNPVDDMFHSEKAEALLSRCASNRFIMDEPTLPDWEHMASLILTGLPIATHKKFFSASGIDDETFAEMFADWRESKAKINGSSVPVAHASRLENHTDTAQAIKIISTLMDFSRRIMDPRSDLHERDLNGEYTDQNGNIQKTTPRYEAVRNVISPQLAFTRPVDPRALWGFVNWAENGGSLDEEISPEKSSVPKFNASALRRKPKIEPEPPMERASKFGTRLEAAITKWIDRQTVGLTDEKGNPVKEALLNEARRLGAIATPGKDIPTISKLLNQDMFAHMGGIKSISALRSALSNRMRLSDPSLKGKSEDDLIPLDQAAALCEEVSRMSINDNDNPHVGRIVTLGDNLEKAFNMAAAVDGIATADHKPTKPKASQLVRTSDFLETLKIPTLANINMRSIWRRTLSNDNRVPNTPEYAPLVQIAEGTHESKIGITTVMTQDANGKAVPTHVLIDGERKQSLIVTDSVDDETRQALGKNYMIVTYDQADAQEKVQSFIDETLLHGSRPGNQELEGQLIAAFVFRAGDKRGIGALPAMMTSRDTVAARPVYMVNEIG